MEDTPNVFRKHAIEIGVTVMAAILSTAFRYWHRGKYIEVDYVNSVLRQEQASGALSTEGGFYKGNLFQFERKQF